MYLPLLRGTELGLETHIFHYALHTWIMADRLSSGFKVIYGCATAVRLAREKGGAEAVAKFVREAILDGIGLERFVSKASEYVHKKGNLVWVDPNDLTHILRLIADVVDAHEASISPILHYGLLRTSLEIGKRRYQYRVRTAYYEAIFCLFRCASEPTALFCSNTKSSAASAEPVQ